MGDPISRGPFLSWALGRKDTLVSVPVCRDMGGVIELLSTPHTVSLPCDVILLDDIPISMRYVGNRAPERLSHLPGVTQQSWGAKQAHVDSHQAVLPQ